jgi:hypothetical protein
MSTLDRFSRAVFTAHHRLSALTQILLEIDDDNEEEMKKKIEERHVKRAERLQRQIEEIMS